MLDDKALVFCIRCIRIVPICYEDLVVGDAAVPEILSLGRALVSKSPTRSARRTRDCTNTEPQEHDEFVFEDTKIGIGIVISIEENVFL